MFARLSTAIPLSDVRRVDASIAQKLRVSLGASATTVTSTIAAATLNPAERRTVDAMVANQRRDTTRTRLAVGAAIGSLTLELARPLYQGALAALPEAGSLLVMAAFGVVVGMSLRHAFTRLRAGRSTPLPPSLVSQAVCNRIDAAFDEGRTLRRGEFAWLEKQVADGIAELERGADQTPALATIIGDYQSRLEAMRQTLA